MVVLDAMHCSLRIEMSAQRVEIIYLLGKK